MLGSKFESVQRSLSVSFLYVRATFTSQWWTGCEMATAACTTGSNDLKTAHATLVPTV